jgi:hypothetical protein
MLRFGAVADPFGMHDETLVLKPVKRRIQRPLQDLEPVV